MARGGGAALSRSPTAVRARRMPLVDALHGGGTPPRCTMRWDDRSRRSGRASRRRRGGDGAGVGPLAARSGGAGRADHRAPSARESSSATRVEHGVDSLLVGVGGSATNDGGAGACRRWATGSSTGTGARCRPAAGPSATSSASSGRICPSWSRLQMTVMTDVLNPLCGPTGCQCRLRASEGSVARGRGGARRGPGPLRQGGDARPGRRRRPNAARNRRSGRSLLRAGGAAVVRASPAVASSTWRSCSGWRRC